MSRFACMVVLALLLPLSGGCIILPIPHPERTLTGSRKPLDEIAAKAIRAGDARADVLLRLGEPDYTWEGGRRLVYAWSRTNLYMIMAAGAGYSAAVAAGDVPINYFLLLEFDEAGGVRRQETRKAPDDPRKFVRQLHDTWAVPGAAPLAQAKPGGA